MSRWRRRLDRRPDQAPLLPLPPEPTTNGEFVPAPATAADHHARRLILERVEHASRMTGIDRRRLLQGSAGVAASLAVYGCTDSSSPSAASSTTTTAGGTFTVPSVEDVEACEQALAGSEFIFDVHTHHVVPDGPWRENARRIESMIRGLVPAGCREADELRCVDRSAYLHDLFLASDTTVALLSDVPNSGPLDAPVPWEAKRETRALAETLTGAGAPRVLLHDVIAPNFGDLRMRLDEMEATVATGDVAAFKVYTAWGPDQRGFALDSDDLGIPVIEQARSLGVKVMCAHKGLPLLEFDRAQNGPRDMVALSRRYPDMQFVIYHGAYERDTTEGPYDPARAAAGIDSLVKALEDHGVGPNENVWAELGTTWREVLRRPTEAAHTVGKLLKHVGEERVLWGTDAIWYGSPQPQIMAFRAFDISPDFQERYGYPALTPELKQKVFGSNAASLFGVDAEALRCGLTSDPVEAGRQAHGAMVDDGYLTEAWAPRGPTTRRQFLAYMGGRREPWTP